MRALLLGADRLGNIPEVLAGHGITIVGHVTGRNPTHQRRMPESGRQADLMILFTDFLGHNVMKQFRAMAEREGIRVLACRRSISCLVQSLAGLYGGCDGCALAAGRA
ncbi:MAG TPA: DUF2325 domain-containing protein [Burkholderiales bacterium]|nr:DUF2325 domain-containing protein [Burkholderiales bacterium]